MLYPLSYGGRDLSENVSEIGAQVGGPMQTRSQQSCGGMADAQLCHRPQCSGWCTGGRRVGQVGCWVAGRCGRSALGEASWAGGFGALIGRVNQSGGEVGRLPAQGATDGVVDPGVADVDEEGGVGAVGGNPLVWI